MESNKKKQAYYLYLKHYCVDHFLLLYYENKKLALGEAFVCFHRMQINPDRAQTSKHFCFVDYIQSKRNEIYISQRYIFVGKVCVAKSETI
jgi:hypothetical protein